MYLEYDPQAVRATFFATSILLLKVGLGSTLSRRSSFSSGNNANDDVALGLAGRNSQHYGMIDLGSNEDMVTDLEKGSGGSMEARWKRVVAKDGQSLPLALIISWISALFCQSSDLHVVMVLFYAMARLFHTYGMIQSKSKVRSFGFGLSSFCIWIMCLNGLAGSFLRGLGDMEGRG